MKLNQGIDEVVEALSHFDGVWKILHYGSSARGETNPKDVDIAVILDEGVKTDPLSDMEQFDLDYLSVTSQLKIEFQKNYGIPLHLVTYWQSEYNKGVLLGGGRKTPPDVLNEVGIVLYDSEAKTPSRT